MMGSDSTGVIISVCGIATVAIVVVFLAALLLLQVFRSSVFGLAMLVMRIINEPKEQESGTVIQSQSVSRSKRDLRAQAKSLDFDSAVARQASTKGIQATQTTPAISPPASTPSTQAVPPPNFETPSTSQYPSINKRRLIQRAEEGEELDLLDAFGDED